MAHSGRPMKKISSVLVAVNDQPWFGEETPSICLWPSVIQASDCVGTGCPGLGRELKQKGEDLSLTLGISLALFRAGENGPYLAVLSAVMTVITLLPLQPRAEPPCTHLKVETVIISVLMNEPVKEHAPISQLAS